MKFNLNSLRFKISILALFFLAATLVIYSAFLFFSFQYRLYDEFDDRLLTKAKKIDNAITSYLGTLGYDGQSFEFTVSRVVAQTGEHPHRNKIEKLEQLWLGQSRPLGLSVDFVRFMDLHGRPLASSSNFPKDFPALREKDLKTVARGQTVYRNVQTAKENFRMILAPVRYDRLQREKNYIVLVASSREEIRRVLKEMLVLKVVGVGLILVIAIFLSELFARRVLKPVETITRVARNINYKDLSLRIKTEDLDVEMKELVDALNEMISRLERSFKYILEFSSHVSHELKTPLAILRGESELAMRSNHSEEEYRQVLRSNLEEIKRMSKIIEDLLLLTKLDYQPDVFKFEEFDLVEFFKEITDAAKILANQKSIEVGSFLPEEPLKICGDKVHLRRLFFNLINNAIKFTYSKGSISLRLKGAGRKAVVTVTDTGVGIPPEVLPKIFDKFFHYSGFGMENSPGNGLGLSIAQSIAKVHSGDIHVESTLGKGTSFIVRLPLL